MTNRLAQAVAYIFVAILGIAVASLVLAALVGLIVRMWEWAL